MTTMTILEAKKILDIVSVALQESAYEQGHKHRPVSALRGYDLQQICTALKLHIANEYLRLAEQDDFELQFAEGLKLYDSLPWLVMDGFVADKEVDDLFRR